MNTVHRLTLVCLALSVFSPFALSASAHPQHQGATGTEMAFPGALGWAAHTKGGRDGRIVPVTTLNATGPGSFTEAVAMKGPRIIVFEVGGVIDLKATNLVIKEPFLTVAGQTAPSPGITFIRGGLLINTHDVILRHIRVRPGEAGHAKKSGWEPDGLSTQHGAHNIIVDHCSFTWGVDENLSVSGKFFDGETPDEWRKNTSRRITFSNNIIAEGLHQSTHPKGGHSKGSLLMDNTSEILIYGNLYASNVERNPQIKGGSHATIVNNFIYNAQNTAIHYHMTHMWNDRQLVVAKNEVVGNVFRHGPDTNEGLALFRFGGQGDLELHEHDNLAFDRNGNPAPTVYEDNRYGGKIILKSGHVYWPEGLVALPVGMVQDYVVHNAGARPWDRDPIDSRIVRQAVDGTGRVIHSEEEVEGYPVIPEVRRKFRAEDWDLRTMTRRQ